MDIKRIKQLAGLTPVVESWSGKDFSRFMREGSSITTMTMSQLKDEASDIQTEMRDAKTDDQKTKLQAELVSVRDQIKKKHAQVKEAWGSGSEDDLNDYERNQGLDSLDDEDGDDDVAVSDDPSDEDPDAVDGLPPRVQSPSDAKRAAAAIAAMRRQPAPSAAAPEADVGGDESVPTDAPADVASGNGAADQMSPDVSVPSDVPPTVPGLADPAIAPPAAGGETAAAAFARGDKVKKAREYLGNYKTATRKEFMTYAAKELGMGPHYANTLFYALKKKMVEFYVVANPANGKVLAEHSAYDIPVWTAFEKASLFNPGILTQRQAAKASEHLTRYGHVNSIVRKSINEDFQTVSESNQELIGKTVKFKSKLTERVGTLTAIEDDRAYFLDKNNDMWSAPLSDLKA